MVAAIAPRPDQHLVEIGPGTGALTGQLVGRVRRLDVVEIDRDLCARLRDAYADHREVHVHQGDALAFKLAEVTADQPLRVVGNLPYNISTPLIFSLLAERSLVADMHFMLQREVVERLAARAGEPARGRLGVMVQYHCEVESLFEVGRGAFIPAPRVRSAVVRLRVRPRPAVAVTSERAFADTVAALFQHRRKTVRNTLRGRIDADTIRACGVDPGTRAERLELADFAALAQRWPADPTAPG